MQLPKITSKKKINYFRQHQNYCWNETDDGILNGMLNCQMVVLFSMKHDPYDPILQIILFQMNVFNMSQIYWSEGHVHVTSEQKLRTNWRLFTVYWKLLCSYMYLKYLLKRNYFWQDQNYCWNETDDNILTVSAQIISLFISLTSRKCKKNEKILQIILVQGLCPLKLETAWAAS